MPTSTGSPRRTRASAARPGPSRGGSRGRGVFPPCSETRCCPLVVLELGISVSGGVVPDEDGFLRLATVEHAEGLVRVVDAEPVGHELLDRKVAVDHEAGDVGPLVDREVPPTGDCQQLADDLIAGIDLRFAALSDERNGAELGGCVQRGVLGHRCTRAVDRDVDATAGGDLPDRRDRVVTAVVDENVGSQPVGKLQSLGEQVHRDDPGAERLGDEHGGGSHRTEAEHGDRLAAAHAEDLLGVVLRADHVGHQGSGDEGDFVGQRESVRGRQQVVVGIPTVDVEAEALPVRAEHQVTRGAVLAVSASEWQVAGHAVPDRQPLHVRADLDDLSRRLVPRHGQAGAGRVATDDGGVADVQAHVTSADGGCTCSDQDLTGSGCRGGTFYYVDLPVARQDHSSHGEALSREWVVYLTAPKVSPDTMRRRRISVITRMGATITVEAAVSLPQSVPNMPVNSWMPTGAVLASFRVSDRANRNSFHDRIAERMATVAMDGPSRGRMMRRSTAPCPAPATIADSWISEGIWLIELRRIHTAMGRLNAA